MDIMVIHSHGISGKKVTFDLAALQAINKMVEKLDGVSKYLQNCLIDLHHDDKNDEYDMVKKDVGNLYDVCTFLGKITDGVNSVDVAYDELVKPDTRSEEDEDSTNS